MFSGAASDHTNQAIKQLLKEQRSAQYKDSEKGTPANPGQITTRRSQSKIVPTSQQMARIQGKRLWATAPDTASSRKRFNRAKLQS